MITLQLQAHDFAKIFPMLDDQELQELAGDIAANGLRDPIILYEGKILDGRNRYEACYLLGIESITNTFEGSEDEAFAFVCSKNFHRRHLNATQRALLASDYIDTFKAHHLKLPVGVLFPRPIGRENTEEGWLDRPEKPTKGNRTKGRPKASVKQSDLTKVAGSNERMVRRTKAVKDKAAPEVVEAMRRGEIRLDAAEQIARMPHEEQKALVEQGPKAVKEAASKTRGPRFAQAGTHDQADRSATEPGPGTQAVLAEDPELVAAPASELPNSGSGSGVVSALTSAVYALARGRDEHVAPLVTAMPDGLTHIKCAEHFCWVGSERDSKVGPLQRV